MTTEKKRAEAHASHTPGPWVWVNGRVLRPANPDPEHSAVHTILEAEGGCGFIGSKNAETRAELDACFALIAQAPTLLQALQDLHAICDAADCDGIVRIDRPPSEEAYRAAMLAAESAIALATGPLVVLP